MRPALPALAILILLACSAQPRSGVGKASVGTEASAACAQCHASQAADLRASHRHAEGCLLCHTPHAPLSPLESLAPTPTGRLGPTQVAASCESCHPEATAEFALPYAHPLGASVSCTSCHDPHGGQRRAVRESERRDACVACHVQTRGPFVYEHEGDRHLGCLSCHEAHGSPNRRLLTHAQTRLLCLSCHANLDEIHVQSPGSAFRECASCHTEVHGSNWDRFLRR
jgi:DmsE family decaheme c-type cytochrome